MLAAAALLRGGVRSRAAAAALLPSSFAPSSSASASTPTSRGLSHHGPHSHFFNTPTDDDVAFFKKVLGDAAVVTDAGALEAYNRDWIGKYIGRSRVALKPKTTEQVSLVLAHCNARRLPVVPQGGNTGLVGGSVPVAEEVVLSTAAMNKVVSFDPVSGALVAQAGCILQSLDDLVGESGFTMPLDLGAKGSCQIGGNVSTNAGGLRLLRYGPLHGSVLGLEVVLADGTVLDLNKTLRKDNTGYDLKQLFIGAEGTLGVVTSVAIQCAPKPLSVQLAFLALKSFDHVQAVMRAAKQRLGEILSAVEFLDEECMSMATKHLPGATNPLPGGPFPFYMLIETSGSHAGHDKEKLDAFLTYAMEEGLLEDGTVAESSAQSANVWRVREGITESLVRRGAVYKYDVSMAVADMYELVHVMRRRLAAWPDVRVLGYGHVGDGNLHLNVSAPAYDIEVQEAIEPFIYEWITEKRGSISAEHGLGAMKASAIRYSKPPEAVDMMRQIKRLMDPAGILNPGKVLPLAAEPLGAELRR